MNLSEHFTLAELIASPTARARGIENNPSQAAILDLHGLAAHVLQPIRDGLGRPVRVNSGYRSPALNRAVGGAATSQHTRGQAADIVVPGLTVPELARWIAGRLDVAFDQLIAENWDPRTGRGWVHVSWRPGRRELLTKLAGRSGYLAGVRDA